MSAVDDYRQYVRHAECGHTYATKRGFVLHANAAIAELEGLAEQRSANGKDLQRIIARQEQELAEAQTELAGLRAETERLRVCGNCAHYEHAVYFDERGCDETCAEVAPSYELSPESVCYFTPSHWKERKP